MKHPRYLDLIPRIGVLSKADFSQITSAIYILFSGHLKAGPFFQKQPQILGRLDHDWVVKYVPIPGYPPPGLSKTTSPSQTPRRTWRKPCIKEDASPGRLWCYFLAELTRLEKDPKNHLKKKWKQAPHEVSLSQKMHNKGLIYPTITWKHAYLNLIEFVYSICDWLFTVCEDNHFHNLCNFRCFATFSLLTFQPTSTVPKNPYLRPIWWRCPIEWCEHSEPRCR